MLGVLVQSFAASALAPSAGHEPRWPNENVRGGVRVGATVGVGVRVCVAVAACAGVASASIINAAAPTA